MITKKTTLHTEYTATLTLADLCSTFNFPQTANFSVTTPGSPGSYETNTGMGPTSKIVITWSEKKDV